MYRILYKDGDEKNTTLQELNMFTTTTKKHDPR